MAGGEPLSAFVRWDHKDGDRFPLAWLAEGYANKAVFSDEFLRRLQVKRLAFSLWSLRWYDMQGYRAGVAHARATFESDLGNILG